MTERDALLVLNAVSGLSNRRLNQLLDYLGSAQRIVSLQRSDWQDLKVLPDSIVNRICTFPAEDFLKTEYALIEKRGVNVVTRDDDNYPEALRNIADAPVLLYVWGHMDPAQSFCVSIVGSRRASVYGLTMASRFAERFAECGMVVVSGLARGIDTAAHRGCLKAKGQTWAVLGCGINHIYPPENKSLYQDIASHGAVISEFPMTTPPLPYHFPRRNRIVSGLSSGTVVIEAAHKSGALITADFAMEQGRDVFAVPGQANSLTAQGTNSLIKDGVQLVMGPDEVVEVLKSQMELFLKTSELQKPIPELAYAGVATEERQLSVDENSLYESLGSNPIYLEELMRSTGRSLSETTRILMNLEMKKFIRTLPGNRYVRTS